MCACIQIKVIIIKRLRRDSGGRGGGIHYASRLSGAGIRSMRPRTRIYKPTAKGDG